MARESALEKIGTWTLTIPVIFILIIAVGIPLLIYNAWAMTILWQWFIVPTFQLPPLSIPQAMGLFIVVGALKGTPTYKTRDDYGALFVAMLTGPLISLGLGWLVLWWTGA